MASSTTRDDDENPVDDLVLLGTAVYQCVGIRYYQGVAHPGEFVTLVREPNNPYDRNAIRVDNMHGQKVGHVNKEAAAKLSRLLDNSRLPLTCEASIPSRGDQWKLPLLIEFYSVSPSEAEIRSTEDYVASAIHNTLRGYNFKWTYV